MMDQARPSRPLRTARPARPWLPAAGIALLVLSALVIIIVARGALRKETSGALPPPGAAGSRSAAPAALGTGSRSGAGAAPESGAGTESGAPPAAPATPAAPAPGPPVASFAARLLDGASGEALRGERVEVRVRGDGFSRHRPETTDALGMLSLTDLPDGAHTLTITHAVYLPSVRAIEVPAPGTSRGEPPPAIDIRLFPGDELHGRVLDAAGAPLSGARIKLSLLEGDGLESAAAFSGEDGAFAALGLVAGRWRLTAGRDGFQPRSLEIAVPAADEVVVSLEEDPGFEVLVTDTKGAPVAGARVALRHPTGGIALGQRSAGTSAEGTVRLSGAPLGEDTRVPIEVRHPDYPAHQAVFAGSQLAAGRVTVRIARGGEVAGRVRDGAGRAVRGATVRLEPLAAVQPGGGDAPPARSPGDIDGARSAARSARDGARSVRSVESGEFAFRGLLPGAYRVVALPPGSAAGTPVEVAVVEGETTEADVTLETGAARETGAALEAGAARSPRGAEGRPASLSPGSVSGLVVASRPLEAPVVRAVRVDQGPGGRLERRFAFSSRDLRFRLAGLPPGDYTLIVEEGGREAGRTSGVTVRAGEETEHVRIEVR